MADVPDDADDSVRGGYARLGVAGYYAAHGEHYRNPHEAGVRAAVAAFVERLPAGTTAADYVTSVTIEARKGGAAGVS